jgi:HEAT repeat protein/PBS lyase HEAT-like repeat-containing protein
MRASAVRVPWLALWLVAAPLAAAAQSPADLGAPLEALTSKDTAVRSAAARSLGTSRDPRALDPLLKLLEDPTRDVRWSAVEALGELRDRRAVPPLLELLKKPDPYRWGKRLVAAALGAIGDPRALDPLTALLADEDPFVRRIAALALIRLGDPRALPRVAELLKDPGDETLTSVRRELARAEEQRLRRVAVAPTSTDAPSERIPLRPREWAGIRAGSMGLTEARERLGQPIQETPEFLLYPGAKFAAPVRADSVVLNAGAGGVIESIFVFPMWGTMDRDIRALLGQGNVMPYAEFLKSTGRTGYGAGTRVGGKLHYLPPESITESFTEMGILIVYDTTDAASRDRLVKLLIIY